MIFNPKVLMITEGKLIFPNCVCATSHSCLNKAIFEELWFNFTFQASTLTLKEDNEYIFSLGDTPRLELNGSDYSINIDTQGICVYAKSENDLIRGFMTLLDRIQATDMNGLTVATADCCEIYDNAYIKNRMIHFCIFPETELWELKRFIRCCGALKYTHVVLEFWGMLKYDCLAELSWPCAFTKEEIRPIISEANDLGLEIIPMFNHWGHASAGRVMHGKHVVLDQNPKLQTFFSQDGWCWDIRQAKVKDLLRRIRAELIELCGNGSYFHIGCDEAYNFDLTKKEHRDILCDYINGISEELNQIGRKTIIWGDMFLFKHPTYNPENRYSCNAPSAECEEYMLKHLSKELIIADWQYHASIAPVETSYVFTKKGFDCIICPWDCGVPQLEACINTAKEASLFGVMHTTWHTLSSGMPFVSLCAAHSFEENNTLEKRSARTYIAALLRRVMPSGGNYERAGWSKQQVDFKW